MKLSFFRNPDHRIFDNCALTLVPHHPVLECTADEAANGRSNNEVLHVKVQRANGDTAHLHFSIGINGNGQVFGEVVAMRGDEPPRRTNRVAKWQPPVKVLGDVVERQDLPDNGDEI